MPFGVDALSLRRSAEEPGHVGEAVLIRLPGERPVFLVCLALAAEGFREVVEGCGHAGLL